MMTSTIRKFGVGVASLALVAGVAGPAFAENETLPGFHINNVARLAGLDRIDTSFAVAKHEFSSLNSGGLGHDAKVAYIVNYGAFVDAATAGMLTDGPIIFVDNNRRTSSIVGKFLGNSDESKGGVTGFRGIRKVIAVGGEAVVTNDTLAAVAKAANVPTTERIGGKDRYETSVMIAERIYSQASEGTYNARPGKDARLTVSGSDNRISRVYFANGADAHVVDSMVAGVLDDGPILLVDGTGALPEKTAEFLKKTLPEKYGILGGSSAVSDATVSNARQLAVYGNNWEEAPKVPTYKAAVDELKRLIDGKVDSSGVSVGTSRVLRSADFMGYKKTAAEGQNLNIQWTAKYNTAMAGATSKLSTAIKGGTGLSVNAAYNAVRSELVALYGEFADTKAKVENYFNTDGKGNVESFDFAAFEATELKKNVGDAQDALNTLWGKGQQAFKNLNNQVAQASQVDPSTPSTESITSYAETGPSSAVSNAVPLASVKIVAAWVSDVQAKQLEETKKKLADAQAKLAAGLNQIDYTTEVRLGGKDRFETAAAVAQQWAKAGYYKDGYSSYGTVKKWPDVYVANAWALPDAIAAGQLSGGPILLGNNGDELNKVTKAVAASLPQWQIPTADKTLYGIGGEKVLTETQLRNIASVIDDSVASKKAPASDMTVALPTQTVKKGATGGSAKGNIKPVNVLIKGITPALAASDGTDLKVTSTPAGAPAPTVNANGNISFGAANTVGKFTYTVKYVGSDDAYKGMETSFTIEVAENVYELTGGEFEFTGLTAPTTSNTLGFTKDGTIDPSVTANNLTVMSRPANTTSANDPQFDLASGKLKVTRKALGTQAVGDYTIQYTKDGKNYTTKVTIKKPTPVTADVFKANSNDGIAKSGGQNAPTIGAAYNAGKVLDPNTYLEVSAVTLSVSDNSTNLTVEATAGQSSVAAGQILVVTKASDADAKYYKLG